MVCWCGERSSVVKTIDQMKATLHDDRLQNECLWLKTSNCDRVGGRAAAVEQWAWESEWVYSSLTPEPWCLMDSIMSKETISEARSQRWDTRKEKWALSGEEKAKDADKAASADAPSSQLPESVINSLVLRGTTANHHVPLPNTPTPIISKAYCRIQAMNTRQNIPQWAAVP